MKKNYIYLKTQLAADVIARMDELEYLTTMIQDTCKDILEEVEKLGEVVDAIEEVER